MIRTVLNDNQWHLIAQHCLGKEIDVGRTGPNPRLFVEAVLWIALTGALWRDLTAYFGKWNTVFKWFRRGVKADAFYFIFMALTDDADWLRQMLENEGITPIILPKPNRKFPEDFNKHAYKARHLVKNYFQKIKKFKRIALRACKTGESFWAMISIIATVIHTR